jgi:hypothetical protein
MPRWQHKISDPKTGTTRTVVRVMPMRNIKTGEVEYWDDDRVWTFDSGYAFILSDDDRVPMRDIGTGEVEFWGPDPEIRPL